MAPERVWEPKLLLGLESQALRQLAARLPGCPTNTG